MIGRASSPTYIGRSSELTRLADVVAGGRERPRLVVIDGDGGIGKTRLVAQFLARFAPDELRVLAGGCLPLPGGGPPYAPMVEALRRFARDADASDVDRLLGSARRDLARLVPDLDPTWLVSAPSGAPDRVDRADQGRLFEQLIGLIGRMSAEVPTVLAIEDIQWADDATRDLLMYLGRNLSAERVVVILTLRTDDPGAGDVGPWMADLVRQMRGERIRLEPLIESETRALASELAIEAMDDDRLEAIVARSGGNPLFVEELAAAGGTDRDDTTRLSATLRETIGARIRDLPEAALPVVRILAVAGREVDERLVHAVLGSTEVVVGRALHATIDAHVAVRDPDDDRVSLRHVLLAEVVLDDLLASERRRLHEALATALTDRPDLADPSPAGAAGELARHWWAAERPAEAFETAVAAAAAARNVFAHGEAFQHLRRALDLLDQVPPDRRRPSIDRVGLILAAEEAADLAGEATEAESLVREGLTKVDAVGDPVTAGILHSRLAYHRWLAGHADEALREHRRAVELVPAEPPSVERARVLRGLGGALMGDGRYRESIAVCEAAIDAARAAKAKVEEGRALDMLGMDRVGLGDIEGGIEALEAACAIAREYDPINGLIAGLHNLAYHLLLADRLDDAVAAAVEGIEAAHRSGVERRYGANLRAVAADVLLRMGRIDEAGARIEEARRLDRAGGTLYLLIDRIRFETARGQLRVARDVQKTADRVATDDVDFDLLAYLRTAEAELAAWIGDHRSGLHAVEDGLRVLDGRDDLFLSAPLIALGLRLASDQAEAGRRSGDPELVTDAAIAGERVGSRLARYDGVRSEAPERLTRGLTATLEWAAAERSRMAGSSSAEAWRDVGEKWEAIARPVDAAYARWRAAEAALSGRPDRAGATQDLRAAASFLGEDRHAPLRAALEALAARARIELGRAREERDVVAETPTRTRGRDRLSELGLTRREKDVLALVATGRTNRETGHALGISPGTTAAHVSHILRKLGVSNRIEAATMAAHLGLVDGPSSAPEVTSLPATTAITRTFLFTDIVGSTAFIETVGDDAWAETRSWHDTTLRRLFVAYGGVEIDHAGDGFFVAFPTVEPAFGCAVAIQRTLEAHRRGSGVAPGVRIALHSGEAVRAGRAYTGREVHLAARLLGHAQAGEIVATTTTMRGAGQRGTRPMETVALAGIGGPIEIGWIDWR